MSEHTAEYALVNSIVRILSPHYTTIIPAYVWLTREGNAEGRASLAGEEYGLVVVYPRRPKVAFAGDRHLFVKFNDTVLRAAYEYQHRGIPVLAGSPLVTDLATYDLRSDCVWFELLGDEHSDIDLHIKVTPEGDPVDPVLEQPFVKGPLDAVAINNTVASKTTSAEWEHWLRAIRDVRDDVRGLSRRGFLWNGGYKPFYILLR